MTVTGYWRIMRPVNAIVAGLAATLGYLIATGTLIPSVILLIVIVVLITGAGNTINDYFDLAIDMVNRPDRPIPSGAVTTTGALLFSGFLFIGGILIDLFTNPFCAFFAIFNSILLVVYAKKLKSTPFLGNLAVASLSGSIFLFGGAFAGLSGLVNNVVIALITILAMLAREILKDAEDVPEISLPGPEQFRSCMVYAVLLEFQLLLPFLQSPSVFTRITGGEDGTWPL